MPAWTRTKRAAVWIAALFPMLLGARESCPWLNVATSTGILGGDPVAMTFTHSKKNEAHGTCKFQLQRKSFKSQLSIEVITMTAPESEFGSYTSRCGGHRAPLRAIGNEAVACSAPGRDREGSEEVIGRVRNQAFVIRLRTNDPSITPAIAREKSTKVAELVAGNLF